MDNQTNNVVKKHKFLSSIKKFFGKIFDGFSKILFPSKIKCVLCGEDLKQKQEIEICKKCLKQITFIDENHCCLRCGELITGQGHYCLNCMNHKRKFDIARSVVVYEGPVQQLIYGFKFGGKPYLSATIGNMMAQKLSFLNWNFDAIVPVPVSKSRLKERGYNQALLLANQIAPYFNKPVFEVLEKYKQTKDQVGLNFQERQQNLEGSIKVCQKDQVVGKSILLVDDVMTTGATANICAEQLFKAGAKSVMLLTFAHSIVKLNTEKIDETQQKKKI